MIETSYTATFRYVSPALCESAGFVSPFFSDTTNQPTNIIISGSVINEPLWWVDEKDDQGELEIMEKACRLTLIDFGFARDLSKASFDHHSSTVLDGTASNESCSPNDKPDPLDVSVSYREVRDLSALGVRFFVAPEVLRGLRERGNKVVDRLSTSIHGPQKHLAKETNRPKKCVSDYGLTADAFSVGKEPHIVITKSPLGRYHSVLTYLFSGTTIKYVLTGVPPETDVVEYLASRNHPLKIAARKVSQRLFKKQKSGLTKRFRALEDLPANVRDLAMEMTHYDSRQ